MYSDGDSKAVRESALRDWFAALPFVAGKSPTLIRASDDASFRRYFRTVIESERFVLCDAPPDREKNPEFLRIALALKAVGLRVPHVFAADAEQGFFCLEDLGEQLLLPLLNDDTVDAYYGQAMASLVRLASAARGPFAIGDYDYAELAREMALFPEWFCQRYLDIRWDEEAQAVYGALEAALCARAQAQTQVVVHRDYHARNLMLLDDGEMAIIDFQDAIFGPVTYDLVSLLRDAYCRWPEERVRGWALGHRDALAQSGVSVPADDGAFLQDMDWMGLQRHIKILGIFCRLYLRDGKENYLEDLPLVMAYTREVLRRYPQVSALAEFSDWFERMIVPAFPARQGSSRA